MALTCRQAIGISLAVLGEHAHAAQRLELEEHLAGCARCAREHADTEALMRGIAAVEHGGLTSPARESIRQALLDRPVAARHLPAPAPWARRAALALGLMGAAAATAIVVVAQLGVSGYQVLGGGVSVEPVGSAGAGAGAEASADDDPPLLFRSPDGGQLRLADARVELARGTELVWRGGRRSVELRSGKVVIDVEHREGQHFEVRTPRFVVEVLGTLFSVDLAGVSTQRGVVRVLRSDGSIASRLAAGESWSADAPPPPPPPAITAPAAAVAEEASGQPVRGPALAPPAPFSHGPDRRGRPRAGAGTVAGTLGEARRALARGDAAAARRLASSLFQQSRGVGVEARMLFAESFLIEGRYADAVDGYRVVVRDFPGTEQAESSLYAIAQLGSEHGRRADAGAALRDYLDRYPRGRFAREATERLKRLSPHER